MALTKGELKGIELIVDDLICTRGIDEWHGNFIKRVHALLASDTEKTQARLGDAKYINPKSDDNLRNKEENEGCQTPYFIPEGMTIGRENLNGYINVKKKKVKNEKAEASYPMAKEDITDNYRDTYIKIPKRPPVRVILAAAAYFGVSVQYLLGFDDCPTPENSKIHEITGLNNSTIDKLRTMKRISEIPRYYRFSIPRKPFSILQNAGKAQLDHYFMLFNEVRAYKGYDGKWHLAKISHIEEKHQEIGREKNHDLYYDAIDSLLDYKGGEIINLIAEYLYDPESKLTDPKFYEKGEWFSPLEYRGHSESMDAKDVLLTRINSMLQDLRNSIDNNIDYQEQEEFLAYERYAAWVKMGKRRPNQSAGVYSDDYVQRTFPELQSFVLECIETCKKDALDFDERQKKTPKNPLK